MLKNSENSITFSSSAENKLFVKCEDLDSSIFSSFIMYFVYLSCVSYSFNYPKDELNKWDTLYNIDFRCAHHRGPHHSRDLVHNWCTKVCCSRTSKWEVNGKITHFDVLIIKFILVHCFYSFIIFGASGHP